MSMGAGGLLPEAWDVARDLLVVVGRGAEDALRRLAAAGQQRLLLYVPEGAAAPSLPRHVKVAHRPIELFDAILALTGPLPKRVHVRRQTDPWADEELYLEVRRTVEDALRAKRLQAASIEEHGPQWLLQGVRGLPAIASHPSIAALDGAFVKRPCFIVSPGPSLETNVARLRAVRGRAVILTCTHALLPLQRHGVVPDLVMAADAGPDLLRHYQGVDTSGVEALVLGASCDRAHWTQPARRRFAFASNAELDAWAFEPFGEDASLASGGSVACSELSLALRMGCDPITLVGQDLAFTDGRIYSDSNVDGSARVKASDDGHTFHLVKPPGTPAPGAPDDDGDLRVTRRQELVKVPGYHGGLVTTSGAFLAFLTWFQTVARSLEGRVMLVNATEGGASIRGMQQMPLKDAISAWVRGPVDVAGVLESRAARVDLVARRAAGRAHIERLLAELGPCRDLATRAGVLAHQARRDPARLERLRATEAELIAALRPMRFLSLFAQGEILRAQEAVLEARSLEQNLAAAERLYQVVERACAALAEPLEAARAELE